MSTLLYTQRPCGCLVLVLVNDAENLRACSREIAREAREGRTLHEAAKDTLPPLMCDEHRNAEEEAHKPKKAEWPAWA